MRFDPQAAVTEHTFRLIGEEMLGINPNRVVREKMKEYVSFFGTVPVVCADLWALIDPINAVHPNAEPKHLLWALYFLTKYNEELTNCKIVGIKDPKTFREWAWLFVNALADADARVIVWNHRFQNWDHNINCLVSIDGTDCSIKEPWPFNTIYYSQKLNGPGLKYEVAVAIMSDNIVWVNGPFPAGTSDLTIFREGLLMMLADDEGVECDNFYKGEDQLKNPKVHQGASYKNQKKKVRARHENLNARLKLFKVLDETFRHDHRKHGICFRAVAVVVQTNMNHDRGSLFEVEYNIRY